MKMSSVTRRIQTLKSNGYCHKDCYVGSSKQRNSPWGADQSRPNLLGIRFCATKGTLWAVGTNASMLSYMKVDGEFANGAFTLPIEMVSHVLTWMDESDDPVTLDVGDYIRITAGNTVLFARKLEGHYPDFFRLVDTPFEYEVQTSCEAFLAELERAKLIDQYVTAEV